MANTKKITGAGNKPKPRTDTYYHWDKNINYGWLPKGADNPITTYAKGVLAVLTGVVVRNPNEFYHHLRDNPVPKAAKLAKITPDYKDYKRTIAGRGDTHALDLSVNTPGKYGVDY
jgi:hypothetical protein|tara:strand:+ start:127 stop:474 length:348 start_codon:yes stop_codon:yes gene_type:complete